MNVKKSLLQFLFCQFLTVFCLCCLRDILLRFRFSLFLCTCANPLQVAISTDAITLGPVYSEFDYYDHQGTKSFLFSQQRRILIDINVKVSTS